MKFIVSLWSKTNQERRRCSVVEVELDDTDLCEAACRKSNTDQNKLYNWQLERIEP